MELWRRSWGGNLERTLADAGYRVETIGALKCVKSGGDRTDPEVDESAIGRRQVGEVRFVDKEKEFGFIDGGTDSDDFWFALDYIEPSSRPQVENMRRQLVEFTPEQGDRGPIALRVRVLANDASLRNSRLLTFEVAREEAEMLAVQLTKEAEAKGSPIRLSISLRN
jgi:cold shock CspA family protein